MGAILVGIKISLENVITAPGSNFEICSGRKARGVRGWIGRWQLGHYKGIFTSEVGSFPHYSLIRDRLPSTIAPAWTKAWWRRKQKESNPWFATFQDDVAFCNAKGTSPSVPLG